MTTTIDQRRRVAFGIEVTRQQLSQIMDIMEAGTMLSIDHINASRRHDDDDTFAARVECVLWEVVTHDGT